MQLALYIQNFRPHVHVYISCELRPLFVCVVMENENQGKSMNLPT